MKILITSDWNTDAVNGVVTSIVNLRDELEKRGHEVRFLTLSPNHKNRIDGHSYMVGSVSAEWIYHLARLRCRSGRKIIRQIIEWGPDVVHSQCEFSSFFLANSVAKKCHVPLLHTCHTVYEDYVGYVLPVFKTLGVKIVRSIFRFCSKRSDLFIAPTEKVRHLLLSYPVCCPVSVVPTGIKLTSFEKSFSSEEKEKIRASAGIGKRRMLLYVGRLGKEKNISELLLYISRIRRDDVSLVIVGDGPYRKELEAEAESLSLSSPKVIFVGMVAPEEVYKWYRSADMFLNASRSETQGLTYIEALSSSLPLLVRKDACLEGVVENGANGWMYENEEEFDSYLEHCLSLSDTSFLRMNAEKTAREFSSVRFADRIEALYSDAAARGQKK